MKKFDFIKNISSFRIHFGICIKNAKKMLKQVQHDGCNVIARSVATKQSHNAGWFAFAITALLFIFSFISCNIVIGLGEEVDVKAPSLVVTSQKDNDTVPSEFTLSGTASDNDGVKLITVDFEDADLHYKVSPGSTWQKKNSSNSEWTYVSDGEGSCVSIGDNSWKWSIYIDTNEKSSSKTDTNFSLEAVATDEMGNSSSSSKVEILLVVDENNPNVTVNVPTAILTGSYDAVKSKTDTYALKNGDVLSKLLNGDLTFSGRQENSLSFKQLRIEFDNGKLSSGTVKVTGDAELSNVTADEIANNVRFDGEAERPTVYFSKTLTTGENGISDLRSWEFTVAASDWINDEKNSELKSGMHLIRVVSTSVSDSLAWQRKIIGYFVWWPEADTPWINIYSGDESDPSKAEIYPSANISGNAYDDDGIQSITYTIQNGDNFSNDYSEGSIKISDENAKYTAWAVTSPSENGNYKITLKITDIYGVQATPVVRYFKVLDVSPPSITISSLKNGSSALANSDANLTFSGIVSDDGTVESFRMVYLNPAKSSDTDNRTKYLNGSESDWENASTSGYTDKNGNIVYLLDIGSSTYDSSAKLNKYTFSKTLNLFDDLGIDGSTKLLEGQDFIFRAIDNGGTTKVESISLTGDSKTPELTVDSLKVYTSSGEQKGTTVDFDTNNTILVGNGYYAVAEGTWKDNSTTLWNDSSKISDTTINFGTKTVATKSLSSDGSGTWTAKLESLPSSSSAFVVSITDFGGNTKKVSKSVLVEGAEPLLTSISSDNDDGSYGTGKEISINLEFSKNVNCTYTTAPTLTLSNGATATYSSGSGTAKHVYKYTVSSSDTNTEKLGVSTLNSNGATWTDKSTSESFTPILPTDSTKTLEGSRSIAIDTVAPTISSVSVVSAAGYYNVGKQISLMLEFSENVSVENVDDLKLVFTHQNGGTNVTTTSASGTSVVIFSYDVASGDNSDSLALSSISHDGVTVTDNAGNALSDWTLPNTTFSKTLVIDTTVPDAPTVSGITSGDIILDSSGTSFTVSGEDGATIEYTTDGSTWSTYKDTVSLSNNGTYTVSARQTDKAGNVSAESTPISVTVDKGELLKRISASTVSGTYSTNTSTSTIEGYIEFRKEVTIASGAYVTLNVANSKDSSTPKNVALNECSSSDASGTKFTFSYEISDGDYISDGGKLDVTDFSFSSVTCSGSSVSMSVPYSGEGRRLNENREIYIYTGEPSVSSVALSESNNVLTITFDRDITKVSGNIVLTQTSDYYAPAVLTTSEYNDLATSFTNISDYYTAGTNGATESSGVLTNDTTTKYILNYSYDIDDSTVVAACKSAGWNAVTIPIIASSVAASGKTLTITLGSTYELPTKGATYSVEIPAEAVVDAASNKNSEDKSYSVTTKGVESPVIRVNKPGVTITGNDGNTPTTSAVVTQPATAGVKMSCRTPDATIYYNIAKSTTPTGTKYYEKSDSAITSNWINMSPQKFTTLSDSPTAVTTASSITTQYSSAITIGDEISGFGESNLDSALGQKFAISAYAKTSSESSDISYEYATRTVLRFIATGKLESRGEDVSSIEENGTALTLGKLRVWVIGGDAPYGGNSMVPFPLSWSDPSSFKLMSGSFTDEKAMTGYWYWVSWDITTNTYHGFVIGDVPSDATTSGPKTWYAAECAWVAQKSNYVLYPGETLSMVLEDSGSYQATFLFRLKNKGSR